MFKAIVSLNTDNPIVLEAVTEKIKPDLEEAFDFSCSQDGVVLTDTARGPLDNEWFIFALTIIPAMDSTFQIYSWIKEIVTKKISRKMRVLKKQGVVHVTMKISLPGFSYEKTEEIEVREE